jgi:subtilisin-like proprotein convertase family protein
MANRNTRVPSLTTASLAVLAAAIFTAPASAATGFYSNATPISIPSGTTSAVTASPYPSPISVVGVPGVITDVTVTLRGFKAERPHDVDILLASPEGDASIVMSDACPFEKNTRTWIFSETLVGGPLLGTCPESVYRPTDNDSGSDPDSWPLAPPGSYPADLDSFVGENPNGTWRLFVLDDLGSADNGGSIAQGWSLQIDSEVPEAFVPGPGEGGLASPYATTRTVGGVDGVISDLNVRLDRAYHELPDDLDLLLVGPRGQKVVLMSDACGSTPAKNAFWTWDDEAAAWMPDSGSCPSASYRPSDHEPGDSLPGPAPAGPYGTALSAFDGTDPNGEWRLYAYDDRPGFADAGFFVERFDLQIETRPVDAAAPETTIDKGPNRKTERRTARFRFSSSEPGSTFECKLDRRKFKPCSSARRLKRLRPGRHRFAVRAIDAAGNVDPTPAKHRWRVLR